MDPLCLVLVAFGDDLKTLFISHKNQSDSKTKSSYLNNFITREFEEWNIRSIAGHEIAVQHPQNTFVGNDEQVGLFPL
jgi:hypothetical protein